MPPGIGYGKDKISKNAIKRRLMKSEKMKDSKSTPSTKENVSEKLKRNFKMRKLLSKGK